MNLIREGQTINGKYQIIEKIGEGATSRVYLAYDLISERNVSLKVLKEDNLTDKKIKNFKKEAHAISLLNHENIIKIYEINKHEHTYFIAQEYIEGMSLKEYIENTDRISTTKAVDIVIQILEGLAHAHEKKVVHKDIKSQNILLGVNGEVKITDFGIADILEDDITKTQSLMGTPQYVAPEVLNKGVSTHQTDIYSTGILLYELLIGHAPFYGEKPTVIILKQLNQPIPSVKQQRDEIPQSLENILIRATAKKLSNRYQTSDDMIDDLRTCFNISKIDEEPLIIKNDFEYQDLNSVNLSKIREEEDKEEKSRTKRNYLIILLISFGLLFLVVVVNLIVFFNNGEQLMPDLKGENYEEAIGILETLNIDEGDIEIQREESKEYDKNLIIDTEPAAGAVMTDETIILIVSNGIESFDMGNYVGKSEADSVKALESLGVEVEVFYEKSEKEKGTIINQSPEEGREMFPGDPVTLIVSNGLDSVKVLDFVSKTEEEFDTWISENNLNSSKSYVCSNKYAEGVVISQSPAKDEEIQERDLLEVKISSGSCLDNNNNNFSQDSNSANDNSTTEENSSSDSNN